MGTKNEVTLTFAGDAKKLTQTNKQVGTSLDKVGKRVDSGKDKFKRFNKSAAGFAKIGLATAFSALGVSSVKLSQSLTQLDAKASAVFEDQLKSIEMWADTVKRSMGLSQSQVVGLAANFADLLKPMGFTAEEAAGMSQEVLGLAGALADWSGGQRNAAEVSEILSKAMLGEREQLKSLGISISEADVKQRLAKNGTDELTGAALQQARAIATQELIMEKSTDAQDAWANGAKEAAEQQNANKVTIQELRESLARGLTPAIEVGTRVVAKFAGWAEENQGIVKVLAGVTIGLASAVLVANGAVRVYSAAVRIATAVQWLLNAALTANPIGIVVVALAALAAGIVIAWKKSETFRKVVRVAMDDAKDRFFAVRDAGKAVLDFFRDLPGNIGRFFSGLGDTIKQPFVSAFREVKTFWNSNIGGFGFDIPDWLNPFGGQKSFRIPSMHQGGIVPGAPGQEQLTVLQAGERVTAANQASAGRMVIELRSGGTAMDDALVEILARSIRNRGGDVQLVLGAG